MDDSLLVFIVLGLTLAAFVWGRFRFDLVALASLLASVVLGLVPADQAFSGFGHPAVITVVAVLVLSRGFERAGVVDVIAAQVLKVGDRLLYQLLALTGLVTVLSGFMNNVGALALLLPVALRMSREHDTSPSILLMPLAFGSLLGGLTTLIGTPPNIIISSYRASVAGERFSMFDFFPVGGAVALAGVAFIVLLGWRLVPRRTGQASRDAMFDTAHYLVEVRVDADAQALGWSLHKLRRKLDDNVPVLALVRGGHRYAGHSFYGVLKEDDILLLEAGPEELKALEDRAGLRVGLAPEEAPDPDAEPTDSDDQVRSSDNAAATSTSAQPLNADGNAGSASLAQRTRQLVDEDEQARERRVTLDETREAARGTEDGDERQDDKAPEDLHLIEAVVRNDAAISGRTAAELRLHHQYGLHLVAVARDGGRLKQRLRDIRFRPGDVLLLQGDPEGLGESLTVLGCLPLADRRLTLGQPRQLALSVGIFAVAITAMLFDLLPAAVALSLAALVTLLVGVLPLREGYRAIDGPVVVLLGAMIPVGQSLESSGGAGLIADAMLGLGSQWPPILVLAGLFMVSTLLSNVINNAAAALLMAPIAASLASGFELSLDPFLMVVAISASCAFLTPIGHQSNTLVMGPAGYHFSDYWRLGLPLTLVVMVVAIPLIMLVWPLQ
ncbi:SLC13 family permease [Halomonas sp. DN3]|uniref:SLC13 family permease n=1 Tax=Halomonas sp. DN3 TaxID=2953657 RepID=UPI00209F2AFE|nr:SLC13 family permease [Halomonas sp. DN3]USZ48465.1 SLC13 family permease [Halomonas sp. DN3]